MSAEVIPFPSSPRLHEPVEARPRLARGDMVLTCINATLGLWCAWPVEAVDDDGVVIAVSTRAGKVLGAERVNCLPDVYGFRASDHRASDFAALRWKTWPQAAEAVVTFAAIGLRSAP
jgi:hypothetical protein